MSNRCSNLCNYTSFSFCTPFLTPLKPYTTTRRPFFPFQHNLVLIGRRSRCRSSYLKAAAQLSSDVVLIATKEHSDGSVVFRFGDASEVVENDDVAEEIESQTEQESSVEKVLDGDQDRQVIIRTDDSGYDSVEGSLVEVADGIRNADTDNGIAKSKTNNAIRDLGDFHAELSERLLDISEKEVLVSQSDAILNDSIEFVENTLNEAKFSVQLDEEDLFDNSPNIEKSADPAGTLLKDSDDKPVDPSISVELQSMQVSQVEVMDDLDSVEAQETSISDTENASVELESTQVSKIEVTDDLDKLEAENTSKGDTENVSVELESTQVFQIEVMDELDKVETEDTRKHDTEDITPYAFPATMHITGVELTDAANEDKEEELKDMIVNDGPLIDELPPSNPLDAPLTDVVTEDAEEELQDVNINEATIIDEILSSDQVVVEQPTLDELSQLQSVHDKDQTMEDELPQVSTKNREENDVTYVMRVSCIQESGIVVGEEVSQLQLTPSELNPTIQGLDIDLQNTMGQNLDNGTLQIDNEIMDPSVSKLEAIQVSDNEVMDVMQSYTKDESQMVESKDAEDLLPSATMPVSDLDMDERLQDIDISKGIFIDEIPTSGPLGAEPTLEVSTTKGMDVKDVDMNERLQGMNISEGTFIDEMPTSNPIGAERTLEVSTAKVMDVKDVGMDERLQNMNSNEGTSIDEIPTSDPIGAEPTLEVSIAEVMNVKDVDMDERLQDMNICEGTFIDEMSASDRIGAEPSFEGSTAKHMNGKDVYMDERLQDMNIGEHTLIDEMPTSDPLGAEPTLEVSTTEGMCVKEPAVEAELQLVSNDSMDENSNADVMPVEPIVEEEVSQPHLTPVELEATMEVSDIPDATGQDLDDEILQVIGENAGDSYIEESSHQIESQSLQDEGVNHNMLEQCAETDELESSILLKEGARDPVLEEEEERTKGIVGSSELAEASEITALLLAAAAEAEVEREETHLTDDFLLSGAALLEHPSKALTGGNDAYFVAGSDWLGVANGVCQWSFEGTDPGVYAQELMRTCEEIVLDTSSVPMTNPVELLCRGVKETKMSGSSNVLIANFNGQSLHVANIGDTGFLIIRHGAVYKKSSPLLHEFHFALQVDDSDDPLQLVKEYLIELEVGDIVVSATDGLFDNLYEREITMIVSKSLQAGMKPQEIANVLATRAQEVGKSSLVRSPFSDAAQAAGYTGYTGGKPDNVAVIVSLVEKRSNLLAV